MRQTGRVYWANLDPTVGREMKKIRTVVVVSPDVMNRNLGTVLVCPLTSCCVNYFHEQLGYQVVFFLLLYISSVTPIVVNTIERLVNLNPIGLKSPSPGSYITA
ncbi:MAG: type II toxin-antitoxin system PemK/MazF family toxin [Cyclobacteriaceae bacterium]